MAFRKSAPPVDVSSSPDKLLRDLPRRRIPDVLPHQSAMMQQYAATHLNAPDVALQLPTGSGKTLVGLLIAEWRRRKFQEKVVYLCPTNQLVNQVAAQAAKKYGLSVLAFTGSQKQYDPQSKSAYRGGDHVAITNYSSVFNTAPYFSDADVLILDDAHAAEGYVASAWSVLIRKQEPEHKAIYSAVANLISRFLSPSDVARLTGTQDDLYSKSWVEKLPTSELLQVTSELTSLIDQHVSLLQLRFAWTMIRDQLSACHVYFSSSEILIRPLIPPTWTHGAFTSPKQRIYMSATLGASGDLERILGRREISRLPIPENWDIQGVGRRFFMFPELSLSSADAKALTLESMKVAGKSVVLVPSDRDQLRVSQEVAAGLGYPAFTGVDMEASKDPFISTPQAVAIMANRYDGVDFPGDECRLLIIEGLPKVQNLQERFIMSRMGANIIFNDRVQTRVLQAIGRCTRSLEDFSAIMISGEELTDYLVDPKRRKHLHPEIQAEIAFGAEQSQKTDASNILDNLRIFLNDRESWEKEGDQAIIATRSNCIQDGFPAITDLRSVVQSEVDYMHAMWSGDYQKAVGHADSVLGGITRAELKGYRGLWHYLDGSAALLANQIVPSLPFIAKAKAQFMSAKSAAVALPWLVRLAYGGTAPETADDNVSTLTMEQVQRIEILLASLGVQHDQKFTKMEKAILDGVSSADSKAFESGHKLLGELLGFSAGKVETKGSPDPWWIIGDQCFVFEDHSDAFSTSALSVNKARQAASHPKWMKDNVEESKGCQFHSVLITPVSEVESGGEPHLDTVALWSLEDFRKWAISAVGVIRLMRSSFMEAGHFEWRARAYAGLEQVKADVPSILRYLDEHNAKRVLKVR